MQEELKKGIELFRKKQFEKAEAILLQVDPDIEEKIQAYEYLVKIAQKQRNVDLKVKRLEELLSISPNHLEAELTRAKLLSMKGDLISYQERISTIINRIKDQILPSYLAGKKLLMGIQFAFSGSEKAKLLQQLLSIINDTIENHPIGKSNFCLLKAELLLALNNLNEFVQTAESIENTEDISSSLAKLKAMTEKIKSPNYPDYNAIKIFGIGLSRTATESLTKALNTLGYQSVHWLNPHTQKLIADEDFLLSDAFTDITVSYQFEKLYHQFPNAKFIFTTRTKETWGRSIRAHYHNSRNISSPNELSKTPNALRFTGEAYAAEFNLYAQYSNWEEAFDHFNKRVRHFFSDKPKDKILTFNICEGDGWETLCPFLGVPIPQKPFPHSNKRPTQYQDK
ncbi:sulfotransferase family protein [Lentimicrobium sp. S6]|uniref:sulfotransferase family protein n=1 Tax=Lentimicrobium sp. S6 TaxID=2735872 RepID=UPI001552ECCB|nr:sulfotransferase family protein [Lentimicrobium sp. S6]NPD47864.1 hypothetical protein [Lentimicrobium sp. S6]